MTGVGTRKLLLLVGLTGAGKSTALAALASTVPGLSVLPDRRTLTDEVLLPEAQRLEGTAIIPVRDRVERFKLTARFRQAHPGGMAEVLAQQLAAEPQRDGSDPASWLVFDNLRGADEVSYALQHLPGARYIVLDCDPGLRVARLTGRADAFDTVSDVHGDVSDNTEHGASVQPVGAATRERPAEEPALRYIASRLAAVPGLARLTDVDALARDLRDLDPEALMRAAMVVAEESLHYDPAASWNVLASLPQHERLRLDTGVLDPAGVLAAVTAWL